MSLTILTKQLAMRGWHMIATLIVGFGLLSSAWADPPTQAGRVADLAGVVWLFDTDNRAWTQVMRNQTIAQGDRLHTDARARVSLRIGSSSVWLEENGDLVFAQLDEGRVSLQLEKGSLGLRLRTRDAVADYTVLTRDGSIVADSEGLFRVDQVDQMTRVFALQGRAHFESAQPGAARDVWLRQGEMGEFLWDGSVRSGTQTIQRDPFNDWLISQNMAQDAAGQLSQSYVSPEMTGSDDLDRYGSWEQASDYGAVWFPSQVGRDWAPYRDGRWVWTTQWGWSWVDDAPWGFAPFHYGRWVSLRGRWAWAPGSYQPRPAYAPALVGWGGTSFPRGYATDRRAPPRQGWTPLTPKEIYQPGFQHSPGYATRINKGYDQRNDKRVETPVQQRSYVRPSTPVPFDEEHRPREPAKQQQQWEQQQRPAVMAPPAAQWPASPKSREAVAPYGKTAPPNDAYKSSERANPPSAVTERAAPVYSRNPPVEREMKSREAQSPRDGYRGDAGVKQGGNTRMNAAPVERPINNQAPATQPKNDDARQKVKRSEGLDKRDLY